MLVMSLFMTAVITVATVLPLASGACVQASTTMIGAPWQSNFKGFEQESEFQRDGDLIGVELAYDTNSGCVAELVASYGRLPPPSEGDTHSASNSARTVLVLNPGETFVGAEFVAGR
jgi:hypothetical protein